MEGFYGIGFEHFERYTPYGTAEQVAESLAHYVAAGATTLNLTPCGPSREAEIELTAEIKRLLVA
jgi:alkanesulfonate monooxygenase SsuD/methylene tetrahydromethanopterin reductase-like flavin-dependent oxidoreductase (luciferase family)